MTWKDPHRYDDMIDMERPVSKTHRPMPMAERAAQFSPFAALTGYDAAVRETARLTEEKKELSEEKKEELNRKLQYLASQKEPPAAVRYFERDKIKEGGAYRTYTGFLKKTDVLSGRLIFTDGMIIELGDIVEIESPCMEEIADV
ncbi:MAG: hypothetical protein K6A40_09010 [Solobacterium sp.]|nr:hypothetical protein [Solobacterium sp.]